MRRILRVRTVAALIIGVLVAAAVMAPAVASAIPAPTQAIYRFYNQSTGAHFYTASAAERDHVMATWPELFTYEGPAFFVYDESMFEVPMARMLRFEKTCLRIEATSIYLLDQAFPTTKWEIC